jgi:hypothetical protein
MKTLLRLIVVLIVLAGALYFARNYIARQAVEAGVAKMTGFPLNIGSLDLDLFQNRIAVRDLSLLNPSEFKEPVFVEMPELTVDYDAGSMLGGTPHLPNLVLDLKRIVIVRAKNGDSNAMKLKGALGGGGGGKAQYKIDTLRLKIGTVELKDYKLGNPMEKTIPINLDETYKDFTDATDINRLVLLTVLKKAGLPSIGIDLGQLSGSLGNITNAAGETLKNLTGTLGKSGTDAAETLKKTGQGLFDGLKKIVPGGAAK